MTPVILYEDNHLIVVVKPAGILSQADGGESDDMLSIMREYVRVKYAKPGDVYLGLVHRLDQNVGGVMVFAKTSKAAARLSEAIREHEFTKRYLAVLEGAIPEGTVGTLVDRIEKDGAARTARIAAGEGGLEAVLDYRSLQVRRVDGYERTLVEVILRSGRFHQIRVQFAHAGHPLVGDVKYGAAPAGRNRIGLFATELAFAHPVTKLPLVFRTVPAGKPFTGFEIPQGNE